MIESVCERILESFSAPSLTCECQLKKKQKLEPRNENQNLLPDQSVAILALSKELAKIAAQKSSLEIELNECRARLLEYETKSENTIIQDNEIEPVLLVKRVKELRERLRIKANELSEKVLGVTRTYLEDLLEFPEPWSDLSDEKRELYGRMQAWCVYVESGVNNLPLNTIDLSKRIREVLQMHGISYTQFANRKLYIRKSYFLRLIGKPRRWTQLNNDEKEVFRKIEKWTRAEVDEFALLKTQIARCEAKCYKKEKLF